MENNGEWQAAAEAVVWIQWAQAAFPSLFLFLFFSLFFDTQFRAGGIVFQFCCCSRCR